jgi:hypothetical protein
MEKLVKKKSVVQDFYENKEKLESTHEGIILFLHLIMNNSNFKCVGLSEKDEIKDLEEIPKGWNKNKDAFVFKYKHVQSSLTFILKLIPLSSSLLIHAIASEDPSNSKVNMDVDINDYLGVGKTIEEKDTYYNKLDKLEEKFMKEMVEKLMPMSSSTSSTSTSSTSTNQYNNQPSTYDPLRIPSSNNNNRFIQPSFGSIGSSDLYPQFPSMPGSNNFFPNQGGNGGGSLVGPDSSLFQRRFRPGQRQNIPSNVPFGARFDPYGPTPNTNYPSPNPDHFRMPNFNDDDDDDSGDNPYFL